MSTLARPVSNLVRPVGSLVKSVRQVGWRPGPDPHSVELFLCDLGYLAAPSSAGRAVPAPSDVESGAARVDDALRRFQAAAGLEVDGRAGASTVHALARARRALLDSRSFAA